MRNFTPTDHDGRTLSPTLARLLARNVSLSSATVYAHDKIFCNISSYFVVTCLFATAHMSTVSRGCLRTMVIQQHAQQSGLPFAQHHGWETPTHERKCHHGFRLDHPRGHACSQASGRQPLAFSQEPASASHEVSAWRSAKFDEWRQRPIDLRQQNVNELLLLLEKRLRKLWLNLRSLEPPPSTGDLNLSDCLQIALWRRVHPAAASSDQTILDSTLRGFSCHGRHSPVEMFGNRTHGTHHPCAE